MVLNLLKNNKQRGYTLVEIMIVVAIIGVLSSISFVVFSSVREKTRMNSAKMFEANHVGTLRNYLVAEWLFDDPTNRYLDSSGNGHDGSCSNCPTVVLGEGFNGKDALFFDGVNDVIEAGSGTNYFPMNTFTMCSWVKTPGLGSGMTQSGIFGITYGLTMFLRSNAFVSYIDNSTSIVEKSYSANLFDDKFHHLCVNFNGVKRNLYIDGSLKVSFDTTWSGTSKWPTHIARIGTELNNPTTSYFKGLIDDTRVYSTYLTASEIQKLYAEESSQRKLAEAK